METIRTPHHRSLAVTLCLTLILCNGCAATFEYEPGSSDAEPPPTRLAQPVRLAVLSFGGRHRPIHDSILDAMRSHPDVQELRQGSAQELKLEDYDLCMKITPRVKATGKGYNFPLAFPGFLILMPTWYELRWTYRIETKLSFSNAKGMLLANPTVRREQFHMAYTPTFHAMGAYVGFFGWASAVCVIAPVLSAYHSTGELLNVDQVSDTFASSSEGVAHAERAARAIVLAISRLGLLSKPDAVVPSPAPR